MQWIVPGVTFLALLITSRIFKFIKHLKAVGHLPGLRCLFSPLAPPGVIISTSFWNPGLGWVWHWRFSVYEQFKSETISVVSYTGRPYVYTRSIEVAGQILTNGNLIKTQDTPRGLNEWGANILTSDHDLYKRHRRVVGSAFGSTISPMVWKETSKTYKEMLADEGWSDKTTVALESFNSYAHKFALILISRCGFGLPFAWTASGSSKGELELGKSMSTIASGVALRVAAPRWLYTLPIKLLQELDTSYKTMDTLMRSFISERTEASTEDKESKQDLFNRLLGANDVEGNKVALDDGELISNVFAFLFAGQGECGSDTLLTMTTGGDPEANIPEIETTARAISITLAFLAVYQEEQDIAIKEIQHVLVNGRDPVFEDYDALSKVKACLIEAMRLYPPAYFLLRDTEDYVKFITPTDKGDKTFVVAPGTRMVVDMIGISYNPRHFEDPTKYKPSRWYDKSESDITLFGLGHRACIGRKFAMAEALCFLTLILRDWVISPLLRDGETVKEWESRVIRLGEMTITLGVATVPLKLTRRV